LREFRMARTSRDGGALMRCGPGGWPGINESCAWQEHGAEIVATS
jgi:hypothetical protein